MVKPDIKAQHNLLVRQIRKADAEYFDRNTSSITDAAYDTLLRELKDLEFQHPELATEESPTVRVGGSAPGTGGVLHDPPMLSLEKIQAKDGFAPLEKFLESGKDYFASPKLDGLACSLAFKAGKLVRIATRGDGRTGEDITRNADLICNLPMKIREKGDIEIRGELIIKKSRFTKLNKLRSEQGEQEFTNLRNAVAGIMRQVHRSVDKKCVDFIAYALPSGSSASLIDGDFDRLESLGFAVPPLLSTITGIKTARQVVEAVTERRESLDYEVDGVVIRLRDNREYQSAGFSQRAPKGAIAWKFEDTAVETVIEGVDYQLGRTGILTPVARLKPVKVAGAVVRKATLHNVAFMRSLGVVKGDTVKLIRSGEVIPKITGINMDERPVDYEDIDVPAHCPSCGTKLVAEGVDVKCVGQDCHETRLAVFKYFVSRPVMNIKGISGKTLEKIFRHGKVQTPADLFRLTLDDFIEMNATEGTTNPDGEHADAKAKMRAIDNARETTLARVFQSMCIPSVARGTAETLAAQPEAESFIENATVGELTALDGIGEGTAKAIRAFFKGENGYIARDHVRRMKANGVVWGRLASPSHQEGGPLSGKVVLITGSIPGYTREGANELVRSMGATVASSVSKKLDLLIVGEKPGASKLEKAEKLGIETKTYSQMGLSE